MPFFWQRHVSHSSLSQQVTALSEQLTTLRSELATTADVRTVQQAIEHLEAQLLQLHPADDIAERLIQLAYHLFREELHVTVHESPLVAGGDFHFLPLDPDEQYDLIFYHPTDPTRLGTRIILNRQYAYTDLLKNTFALHIRVRQAPPGLVESLVTLHAQSGPIVLGYRGTTVDDTPHITYWPYSGTHHNQHPSLYHGKFADHLIFYYLKRGGTLHTYAEDLDDTAFTSSAVQEITISSDEPDDH